jgi:Winged helix DNA-binding domain
MELYGHAWTILPAVGERVLTERELNRALLARQLLLERSKLPIPRALERIGGIQNQYAPNAYIRLASCLEGFRRDALTRALDRRTVVQGTLLRTTIHTVSTREYWHYAVGLRRAVRDWQLRVDKPVTASAMRKRAAALRSRLAEGPVAAKELGDLLRQHTGLWVELVRVPPSGTWDRRRADLYALADTWVGPCTASEDDGLDHLVRAYLRGFGPAAIEDVSAWAGVPVRLLAPSLGRLRLRRFRDEVGRELFDLPRAPLPRANAPAPVRFLPTWDATLLVHARRTGVLPEEYRPIVFSTKNPPSVPTFLVDGRVAGGWRLEAGRVELDPYGLLSRAVLRELREEGARLAAVLSGDG